MKRKPIVIIDEYHLHDADKYEPIIIYDPSKSNITVEVTGIGAAFNAVHPFDKIKRIKPLVQLKKGRR